MKKAFQVLLIAIMGHLSAAQANVLASAPIYLAGGTVPPGKDRDHHGQLFIPLSMLTTGVEFVVTCDIENPNYNKSYPVVIRLSGSEKPMYGYNPVLSSSLNNVTSPSNQYLLNHQISKFKARIRLSTGGNLSFENFDTEDAVYIKSCVAATIYEHSTLTRNR